MRPPSPPVIAGALSGFVIGVLLTLVATGTMSRGSLPPQATPTVPPATVVPAFQLKLQINHIVSKILGPQPSDPRKSRLLDTQLFPVGPNDTVPGQEFSYPGYRSVLITFRLNDHPFGPSWRLRAAEADVFAVMRALYTSQLNVYDVQMDGKFPMDPKHPGALQTALRASMSYDQSRSIPWRHWPRSVTNEARLWRMLTSVSVDPRFG